MKGRARSGLYAYLDSLGLIGSPDKERIAEAKRAFNRQYKREWVKRKRERCDTFLVYLNSEEMPVLESAAGSHQMSVTEFLRKASLAYVQQKFVVPDYRAISSLRDQLAGLAGGINQLIDTEKVGDRQGELLLEHIGTLERVCLELLLYPKRVEERIREEVLADREYKNKLIALLESL